MEQNSKYIDEVEKLVELYGFASTSSVEKLSLIVGISSHIAAFKKERGDGLPLPTIHSYTALEEFKRFIYFLARCKGSEITMTGTITNSKKGEVKGTMARYKFNDWEFLNHLQAVADFEMEYFERFVRQNPFTSEIAKLKGNKLLGFYASTLLSIINGLDLGDTTDTKKYNFIYDSLLLVGITGNKSIDDSGEMVTEKYQAVRNWITAYKKHENKQKH